MWLSQGDKGLVSIGDCGVRYECTGKLAHMGTLLQLFEPEVRVYTMYAGLLVCVGSRISWYVYPCEPNITPCFGPSMQVAEMTARAFGIVESTPCKDDPNKIDTTISLLPINELLVRPAAALCPRIEFFAEYYLVPLVETIASDVVYGKSVGVKNPKNPFRQEKFAMG